MPDVPPVPPVEPIPPVPVNVHGVWFWRLAIFEGTSSTFIVMAMAVMAAGATWNNQTFNQMDWWQWALFWLSVVVAGLKNIMSFVSKTVSSLSEKAKEEETSFFTKTP